MDRVTRYTISGWIAYVILMLYHFLWVLVIAGSTEVPMTLLLVLICFVAFFTLVMWARFVIFPPKDTGTMRNDVRYRCLASIIYLIMLNIWQIIFFAYYYSAATSKEKGDGHFPRFQPSRAAVGQSQLLLLRTIDRGDQHCQLGVECRILLSTRMGDNTSRPNIIGEFRSGKEGKERTKQSSEELLQISSQPTIKHQLHLIVRLCCVHRDRVWLCNERDSRKCIVTWLVDSGCGRSPPAFFSVSSG